jgi:hypothetical protein
MIRFLVSIVLFLLYWLLETAAALLFGIAWIIILPFRLIGGGVYMILRVFKAIIYLPARLVGSP